MSKWFNKWVLEPRDWSSAYDSLFDIWYFIAALALVVWLSPGGLTWTTLLIFAVLISIWELIFTWLAVRRRKKKDEVLYGSQ